MGVLMLCTGMGFRLSQWFGDVGVSCQSIFEGVKTTLVINNITATCNVLQNRMSSLFKERISIIVGTLPF